ncbi:MAG: hypothetical protein K1X55_17025 [Chitinophagales bacterium]|nr:hypothetical protein [Chitinophagales bacterium]
MSQETNQDEIDKSYNELLQILEDKSKRDKKYLRDIDLLVARMKNSKEYFLEFQKEVLKDYPEYKFEFDLDIESKRFATLYAYYLEQFRLYVVGENGSNTKMSVYKIISASQATILAIRPIKCTQDNSCIETKLLTCTLNGKLAQYYGLQFLSDWIASEKTRNQDITFIALELHSDKYISELFYEHLQYLQKLAFLNSEREEITIELFLLAQYWKVFHYYIFDPRLFETDSI